MDPRRLLLVLLVVIAAAGISMLFNGITGMVTYDSNIRPLCSADEECGVGEVCCLFYGEESGVCNEEGMCATVLEVTENGNKDAQVLLMSTKQAEQDLEDRTYMEALFGFIITVAVAIAIYYFIITYRPIEKAKVKRKRRASTR